MINLYILSTVILSIIIIVMGWIMKSIDLKFFGDDEDGKKKAYKRIAISVFICIALVLIMLSGLLNVFSREVFLMFFTAGLNSLGFNLGFSLKEK